MKTTQQLLSKTKRIQYVNEDVLKNAPTGGNYKDLVFFKLDRYISEDDLEKEYTSRSLTPATISCIAEYDIENPGKMDEMTCVGTHWKDNEGEWCCAAFYRWLDEREVFVHRSDDGWGDFWWFAGLKSSELNPSAPSDSLTLEKAIEIVKAERYVIYKPI